MGIADFRKGCIRRGLRANDEHRRVACHCWVFLAVVVGSTTSEVMELKFQWMDGRE
jgi:hypothetical protein